MRERGRGRGEREREKRTIHRYAHVNTHVTDTMPDDLRSCVCVCVCVCVFKLLVTCISLGSGLHCSHSTCSNTPVVCK